MSIGLCIIFKLKKDEINTLKDVFSISKYNGFTIHKNVQYYV